MKHSIIILCFSCVLILVVFYIASKVRTREHFIVKDYQGLKDELEHDSCDTLWSEDLIPTNKAVAGSYLKSKRISKWKSVNGGGETSCYMLDDIKDREMDPFLAGKKCETAFADVPFISNVRVDNSQQTTTQLRTNVCVFDIDTKKTTASNLNDFWTNKIALYDDCIQANAYIIDIYDQLRKEKNGYIVELSNLTHIWEDLYVQKNNLIATISNVELHISTSNVILSNIRNDNYILTSQNFNLKNTLGTLTNDSVKFKIESTKYLDDLSNVNTELQITYNNNNDKINYLTTRKSEKTIERDSWITSNEILTDLYNDLENSNNILTSVFDINTSNMTYYTEQLKTCQNECELQSSNLSFVIENYKILDKYNIEIVKTLTDCRNNSRLCGSQLSNCSNECSQLTTKINYYTGMYNSNVDMLTTCTQRNVGLIENLKNMNLYFDWVRSVYIYLSCDTFEDSVTLANTAYNNMLKSCKDADVQIKTKIEDANKVYNKSANNAKTALQTCTSDVDNIRNDINSKIYQDHVFIHGAIQMACGNDEICPIRNQNEANEIGADVCDNIKDAYYAGKYLNYNGQRGAVYCSYWGDTKTYVDVRSNNKRLKREAGNVLPAGSYSNILSNCYAEKYNLNCPQLTKPYNFKNCSNYISYANCNLSCRPDGYNYLVSHIAICDVGAKCNKFTGGDGWKEEMIDYCGKYPLYVPLSNISTMAY